MGLTQALWPFGGKSPRRAVPVMRRLHAWWEGYDVDAMAAPKGGARRKANDRDNAAFDEMFEAEKKRDEWSATRKKVVQDLLTAGFIVPGSTGYVEELVNGCGLSAAETMLEIGVGMGGGTRAIIGKFGNYVTGYERDPALAEEARKQAVTYDIDSKVEIVTAEPDKLKLKKDYYRAALIRDVLFTVENKEALLEKVVTSLKKGEAQMIITDLMFEDDPASPELVSWMDAEPDPVYPWTLDDLKKALGKLKVIPRIANDESERYRKMVVSSWKEYLARLDGASPSPEIGMQIVHEAEFWARRLAALDAGKLRYVRVVGVRNS